LLDSHVLSVLLTEYGLRLLRGRTFRKSTETLQGLSPLLGKIRENPSVILLLPGKILIKQLDKYGLSMIVPE
jgi:hypothetical protein